MSTDRSGVISIRSARRARAAAMPGLDLPRMRRAVAFELRARAAENERVPRFEEVWRGSPPSMTRRAFWELVWVPAHQMARIEPVGSWEESVARDIDAGLIPDQGGSMAKKDRKPTIIRHRGFEAHELPDGRWRVNAVVSAHLMAEALRQHTETHEEERDGVHAEGIRTGPG